MGEPLYRAIRSDIEDQVHLYAHVIYTFSVTCRATNAVQTEAKRLCNWGETYDHFSNGLKLRSPSPSSLICMYDLPVLFIAFGAVRVCPESCRYCRDIRSSTDCWRMED